ncbi:MAG: 4Fe-4S cluster-binding domain-containing protein [Candidatus Thorarchaeota archaeon]
MAKLQIPEPISAGILLSYKCSSECKHCMYACSPKWRDDWISKEDLEKILVQLSGKIKGSLFGSNTVGLNSGLHFTGGEPFLNFDLLLKGVEMARELRIPSTFVETNCFWCTSEETTKEKLTQLENAGLNGLLISVNPFILEQTPFERTQRAIRVGGKIFGKNLMVYQEAFHQQFGRLGLEGSVRFEDYLGLDPSGLSSAELIPMGRVPYKLGYLFKKYRARQFFGGSCGGELSRDWHVHVDNYCNYMTGYCGGISLGDARDLDSICSEGIDLAERPILNALVADLQELYEFGVKEYDYKELSEGYVSKCHLCVDTRKHIAQQTEEFKELNPREFYYHLT